MISENTKQLRDAELDAVTGGGKNEGSIVFAGKPYKPTLVDVFVQAFRDAGGQGGFLSPGATGGSGRPA